MATKQSQYARFKQRLKDLAVFTSFPNLRRDVHRSRALGLETLLDYKRLGMLRAAISYTSDIEGDVIEFGTFRGGSAGVIIQNLGEDKKLHVCDSFVGMPDVSSEDNFHQKGDFAGTNVHKVNRGLSSLSPRFEIHEGFFDQTIKQLEDRIPFKISFAHIDVDLYESVLACLAFCYPRMSDGGIIIFDDYGAKTCLGAKKAVDEFFAHKIETVVSLSQPAHGCIIGGGNAFEELLSQWGYPTKLRILQKHVFID